LRGRGGGAGFRQRLGLRPLPAVAPHRRPRSILAFVARGGRRADATRAARHERAHAHVSLSPVDRRPSFPTLGVLYPGRIALGVSTGESMNEVPVLGIEWPDQRECFRTLSE